MCGNSVHRKVEKFKSTLAEIWERIRFAMQTLSWRITRELKSAAHIQELHFSYLVFVNHFYIKMNRDHLTYRTKNCIINFRVINFQVNYMDFVWKHSN